MRRVGALVFVSLLVGCGGDHESRDAAPAPATPVPAVTAESTQAPTAGSGSPYIGSLTADPGDGTLIVGTGIGLYRVAPGSERAVQIEGRLSTPAGDGAIASNLVLRFTAPGELVASGHPQGEGALPEDLGLIRSEDGADSWTSVSLLGEGDLHALDARGDRVAGVPVGEQRVLVSSDGGRTFEERVAPAEPLDLDLDPVDPERIVITTEDGLFVSRDRGGSWRQRDVLATETHLAWAQSGELYRVDAGGAVKVSDDGGESWADRGNADGSPTAVAVDGEGRLYVALAGAVIKRSSDGGRTFSEFVRLPS